MVMLSQSYSEHFHWDLYNPFVAIRRIAVTIRKKCTVWTSPKGMFTPSISGSVNVIAWNHLESVIDPFASDAAWSKWHSWNSIQTFVSLPLTLTLPLGVKRPLSSPSVQVTIKTSIHGSPFFPILSVIGSSSLTSHLILLRTIDWWQHWNHGYSRVPNYHSSISILWIYFKFEDKPSQNNLNRSLNCWIFLTLRSRSQGQG